MSGSGSDIGALLSLVTNSSVPFRDAALALQLLFEASLPSVSNTLRKILEDGMLYSVRHKLQAVSLLHYSSPQISRPFLATLAARDEEAYSVRTLARALLENDTNNGQSFLTKKFIDIASLTPVEYERMIDSGEDCAAKTLDSLGISELPPHEDLSGAVSYLKAAVTKPLLPREEKLALSAMCDPGQLSVVADFVSVCDVVAVAENNPCIASSVISHALNYNKYKKDGASVSDWGAACLWGLVTEPPFTLNVMTSMALVLDGVDDVEPAAVAAFISRAIQSILAIDDPIRSNRLSRMLCNLINSHFDAIMPAIALVALELEGFCTTVRGKLHLVSIVYYPAELCITLWKTHVDAIMDRDVSKVAKLAT